MTVVEFALIKGRHNRSSGLTLMSESLSDTGLHDLISVDVKLAQKPRNVLIAVSFVPISRGNATAFSIRL